MHNDPRPELRRAGRRYVYAILHAHQLMAVFCRDPGTGVMVSRSSDGEAIVPTLKLNRLVPVRGSVRQAGRDKGGRKALDALIAHVQSGRPACLTVDGPRGPRNRVHKGIGKLSQEGDAVVLNLILVPSRRWIFPRAWDRLQVPQPFARIDGYFCEPLEPRAGEPLEAYRQRIEASLNAAERLRDPAEAAAAAASLSPLRRAA
jgi:lysophospholipid acyltransferase (LPLAT)-like uncharacterized protein